MYVSMGRLLIYMSRYEEAVSYLEPTLKGFMENVASNWAMAAL
jgi:hypothetical protein